MQPFSFSGSGVNVGFGGIEKILSGRTAESGISTASMEIQHTAPGKCGLSTTSQSPPKPSPSTSIGLPARTALTTSYAEPGPSQQSVSDNILGRSSPGVGVALSTAGAPVDVSASVFGVSVEVAEALDVPVAKIYGVITFYHLFRLSKPGRNRVRRPLPPSGRETGFLF